jgi:hypothetical protein
LGGAVEGGLQEGISGDGRRSHKAEGRSEM